MKSKKLDPAVAKALSAKRIAVPAHLLPGLRSKPVLADIDGFDVPLLLVSSKVAAKLDTQKLRATEARIGDQMYPALTPHFGVVKFDYSHEEFDKLTLTEQNLRESSVAAAKRVAHEYSRLTGINVHMHSTNVTRHEPLPALPDELHVMFGMIPAGPLVRSFDLSMAFGQMLDTRAQYYPRTLPVIGRGVVAHEESDDKDKKPLVQVVGRTAYILMAVLSLTNRAAVEPVFRGLLRLIHDALPLAAKCKAKPVDTARTFNARYHEIRKEFHDWRIERDKELVNKISSTLKEYQNALEDLRHFRSAGNLVHKGDLEIVRGLSARRDFDRIRKMPEVDRIEFIDSGLHIVTSELHCIHEGKTYRLGRYIIRLADHDFTLFCEATCHPKGKIHPHYPNDGVPCWGNVGIPLARAQSEGRLADLVELVIKWLTQGYDHVLAETKIEEWPHAS